jgi:hypothetical protein
MLQPKSYPELMGKALVLEADPFVTLVDDDNPWVEGLFLVFCVGVALGIAHLLGGLLLTASLPPAEALRETMLQGWHDLAALLAPASAGSAQLDASFRQVWNWGATFAGLQGGWARLLIATLPLVGLLLEWLVYGLASHLAARALGGTGKLNQTLGATALIAAPHLLGLLTVAPFVSVSPLLLTAWTLLITYRAVQVSHDLPWPRAVVAALAAPVVVLLLSFGFALLIGVAAAWGGRA